MRRASFGGSKPELAQARCFERVIRMLFSGDMSVFGARNNHPDRAPEPSA
jgi:hypothetical protein